MGFLPLDPLSTEAWVLIHSASAVATGTDYGYLEASRPKQVSNEAVIAKCYVTAKK